MTKIARFIYLKAIIASMSEDISAVIGQGPISATPRPDHVTGLLGEYTNLLRAAMKLTGNEAKAEDLVQSAYLKLITHNEQLTPDALKGWMYMAMHNEYMSQCRHERVINKNEKRLSRIAAEAEKSNKFSIDDEVSPRLARAIQTLPPCVQDIIKDIAEGKAYNDVSAKYGIPIGTVMSRIYRARTTLKKMLAPDFPAYADEQSEKTDTDSL